MSILPKEADGTLVYNGFAFPPAVHVKVRGVPVSDSTGRYTKHTQYTLSVETMLFPGVDTQDSSGEPAPSALFPDSLTSADGSPSNVETNGMERVRQLLTQQGKHLIFVGKGFGHDFQINTRRADVSFGPRPSLLQWEPVGSNKAVRVVWSVVVAISDCNSPHASGEITEFGYEAEYGINDVGYTTRTVSGQLEISQQLTGVMVQRIADQYRERIVVDVPLGFKRTSQGFAQSRDFRVLRWRMTDEAIPSDNPFHQGMVAEDVTHDVSSVGPIVGAQFAVTVSGTYKVAAGLDKGLAWVAFLFAVKSRRDAVIFARLPSKNKEGEQYPHALPIKLSISDQVYGRGFRASMTWFVFTSYETILRATGMFAKVGGGNWEAYRNSMRTVWGVRGYDGLRHTAAATGIVGTCSPFKTPGRISDLSSRFSRSATQSMFRAECPPKHASYVSFIPRIEEIEDTKRVALHSTGETTLENDSPSVIQEQGKTRYRVVFSGAATRVGYKVEKPELVSYGGAKVQAQIGKGHFVQQPAGFAEGCRIYTAYWERTYELEGAPTGDELITKPSFEGLPQ